MDDKGYNVANGNGITDCDPFLVNRQKAVQFNWYGGNTKELLVTVTEQQLKQAFSSSAEFGSFMAAQAQNLINQINQKIEAESRYRWSLQYRRNWTLWFGKEFRYQNSYSK